MSLTAALLKADVEYEVKMVEELEKLQQAGKVIPFSIRALLECQGEINGSIYHNGFLEDLEIVVNHETSLQVQKELQGIKDLIKELLAL